MFGLPIPRVVAWGPPVKVAFDAEGNATKAAEAFANKNGLNLKELPSKVESDGKQDKLCVRRVEEGRDTSGRC